MTDEQMWEYGGIVDLCDSMYIFNHLVKHVSDSGWPIAVTRTQEHAEEIARDHEAAKALTNAVEKGYIDHRSSCALNYQQKRCSCGYEDWQAAIQHKQEAT